MIIGTVMEHIRDFGNSEFERGKRRAREEMRCETCKCWKAWTTGEKQGFCRELDFHCSPEFGCVFHEKREEKIK